jgi:hypothetical protein
VAKRRFRDVKLPATYEFVWFRRTAHDKVSLVKAEHALAPGGDETDARWAKSATGGG